MVFRILIDGRRERTECFDYRKIKQMKKEDRVTNRLISLNDIV